MAYALVNHVQFSGSGANGGTSGAVSMTGANLIVIGLKFLSPGPTAPTDSLGNTYTQLTAQSGSNSEGAVLYYCESPSVGGSMTFTANGTGAFPGIMVAGFSGGTSSSFDQQNGVSAGSTNPLHTGSVTPGVSNELILTTVTSRNSGSLSIDSSFNITDQAAFGSGNNWGGALAYKIKSDALAENPSWSGLNGGLGTGACIATFKPAAAATGKLFTPSNMDGLGSGGPFFSDRLAA